MRFTRIVLAVAVSGIAALGAAQTAQKPAFEVSSVKVSPPGSRFRDTSRGNRLALSGAPLRLLLRYAYPSLLESQILQAPSWVDSDLFDVEAKADCEGGLSEALMQQLVQSLLVERFQLKTHLDTRELSVYALVADKGGPTVTLSEDQSIVPPRPPCSTPPRPGGATEPAVIKPNSPPRNFLMVSRSITGMWRMSGVAVPFSDVVAALERQVGRPFVDKTQLSGLFDISFEYLPDVVSTQAGVSPGGGPATPRDAPMSSDPAPTLGSALQKQLGLRIESIKEPVQVMVIDSVQRPTEN